MFHRFEDGVAEGAGHVAVEGAHRGFRLVAQQVRRGVLVVDRLVRDPPALVEQVVLVIVEQGVGEQAAGGQRLEPQQVDGAGVDIRRVPLVQQAPRREGLGGHVRHPGAIAQLDER